MFLGHRNPQPIIEIVYYKLNNNVFLQELKSKSN